MGGRVVARGTRGRVPRREYATMGLLRPTADARVRGSCALPTAVLGWSGGWFRDGSLPQVAAPQRSGRELVKVSCGSSQYRLCDDVAPEEITTGDAGRAGFSSRSELLAELGKYKDEGDLFRIEFHFAGPDPREQLRADDRLGAEDLSDIERRLSRLDDASRDGPWTREILHLIERRPNTRAADLAAARGQERIQFKRNVRKLKELGLTESLDIGYRLSPRGRALLRHLR